MEPNTLVAEPLNGVDDEAETDRRGEWGAFGLDSDERDEEFAVLRHRDRNRRDERDDRDECAVHEHRDHERGDRDEPSKHNERGASGERGDRNERGERGDRNERGEYGEGGACGERGDRGEDSVCGERGDDERSEREESSASGDRDERDTRGTEMVIIDRQVMAGWAAPTTIEIGASAEQRAVHHLERHGYRIVERNFKTKLGELDIVARDRDGVLCFIEVRSRTDDRFGNAAESVNHLKRGKVTKMAQVYLMQRRPQFDQARFDVVALTGDRIDLIRDAWRLGDQT